MPAIQFDPSDGFNADGNHKGGLVQDTNGAWYLPCVKSGTVKVAKSTNQGQNWTVYSSGSLGTFDYTSYAFDAETQELWIADYFDSDYTQLQLFCYRTSAHASAPDTWGPLATRTVLGHNYGVPGLFLDICTNGSKAILFMAPFSDQFDVAYIYFYSRSGAWSQAGSDLDTPPSTECPVNIFSLSRYGASGVWALYAGSDGLPDWIYANGTMVHSSYSSGIADSNLLWYNTGGANRMYWVSAGPSTSGSAPTQSVRILRFDNGSTSPAAVLYSPAYPVSGQSWPSSYTCCLDYATETLYCFISRGYKIYLCSYNPATGWSTQAKLIHDSNDSYGHGASFVNGKPYLVGDNELIYPPDPDITVLPAVRTFQLGTGAAPTVQWVNKIALPVADSALGEWTTGDYQHVDLYRALDDLTDNNADYLQSPIGAERAIYRCRLSGLTPPTGEEVATLIFTYRVNSPGNTTNLKVRLLEGAAIIKELTYPEIPASWTKIECQLISEEVATIGDWGNLFVELEAYT